MDAHLDNVHKIANPTAKSLSMYRFACVYCRHNMKDREDVERHLSLCHPDELPYVCERRMKLPALVS